VRFIFDEGVPIKLVRALRELDQSPTYKLQHLRVDLGIKGEPDEDWISKLPMDEQCTIISRDPAMRNNELAYRAWASKGHNVVFLANQWGNAKFDEIAWRFIRWWPQIRIDAHRAKRGTIFRIPYNKTPSPLTPWR
jgi:hypothetical protein